MPKYAFKLMTMFNAPGSLLESSNLLTGHLQNRIKIYQTKQQYKG